MYFIILKEPTYGAEHAEKRAMVWYHKCGTDMASDELNTLPSTF